MYHWIIVHWFELTALGLLALNLWFVAKVLNLLMAVQDSLLLLARFGWTSRGVRPKPGRRSSPDLRRPSCTQNASQSMANEPATAAISIRAV